MYKKLVYIITILTVSFCSLTGCGNYAYTTPQHQDQKSEQKVEKEPEYVGTYSQTFESDNVIGACDDGAKNGCKYEVVLTPKNITVYYTNSVGTTMVWYGNASATDVTKKYNDVKKAYSIVSTLDPEFTSKTDASTAMFGYEGRHKEFTYVNNNGTKHIEMDVPDSSEDALFDTTNINLFYLTQEVI